MVTRVCVSVCVSVCPSAAACTDPDVTWGSGRGCALVVQYWADLQSVHGLRCYDNITRTRNVSVYMLLGLLALCLLPFAVHEVLESLWHLDIDVTFFRMVETTIIVIDYCI